MLSIANKDPDNRITYKTNSNVYETARHWIGRRLVLRKPLLDFVPGTRCVVMCVADFGDGPLLWIVTNDNLQTEVDQMELCSIPDYFLQEKAEIFSRIG